MSKIETDYTNVVRTVLSAGSDREDRTGVGTIAYPFLRLQHEWSDGAPILTGKKVYWKGALRELLWFWSGSTAVKDLHPSIHKWWQPFTDSRGTIGDGGYGTMWRSQRFVDDKGMVHTSDQLRGLVKGLNVSPHSRRHVVSLWNSAALSCQELPPCHSTVIQAYAGPNNTLEMFFHQRSADILLGLPVNLCQAGIIHCLLGHMVGMKPTRFHYSVGDGHIYKNHRSQMEEYVLRTKYDLPKLEVVGNHKFFDTVTEESLAVSGYQHSGSLTGDMAV